MTAPVSPNRRLLEQVAKALGSFVEEVVFVGGQVAELLVTSPAAIRVRATDDVDVVVSAATRIRYAEVERRLRELGLKNDGREDAPVCRWLTSDGFPVDVMPVEGDVLGFSNRWYVRVVETLDSYPLTENLTIRIPPAPLYVATKWEAFSDRGVDDMLRSHDLEDIILVVAGRPEVIGEIETAPEEVRTWLAAQAAELLKKEMFEYAVQGALPDAARIPSLIPEVLGRFRALSLLA